MSVAEHLPTIDGDRIELQQVLLNLIVNAIDAMETVDPAVKRLDISTAPSASGGVQVSVSDDGIGLGAVDMARLFTLSYTTKTGGTGVGLSISRSTHRSAWRPIVGGDAGQRRRRSLSRYLRHRRPLPAMPSRL